MSRTGFEQNILRMARIEPLRAGRMAVRTNVRMRGGDSDSDIIANYAPIGGPEHRLALRLGGGTCR